jgi:methionine-rich copper-binding protein CopC
VRRRVRSLGAVPAVLLVTAVAFAGLLTSATSASAHDALEKTSPQQGSSVSTPPPAITLTFNEPAFKLGSKIRVIGPAGDVAVGEPVFKDQTVRQGLRPDAPAGAYTVEWQVTSSDGHPVAGRWTYSVQQAGVAATTAPPTAAPPTTEPVASPTVTAGEASTAPGDDGSGSTGVLVAVTAVGAVVLLGAAAVVALTTRRRSG